MRKLPQPPRFVRCWVLAAVFWLHGHAQALEAADRPVVALITEQRDELPWIDVAEAALGGDTRIRMVDREHLDKVFAERRLTLLMDPRGGAARTRVGKLLGCDLLIVLRYEPEPKSVVHLVIADTSTGIRLVNAGFPAKFLAAKQQLPGELLTTALKKRKVANPIVLAIPPFTNDDLSRENEFLQSSLAAICETVAARHPRFLLVELDEARELAQENSLTARKTRRALPHYLLGRFRLETGNDQRPPFATLTLERGDSALADKRIESPTPATIGPFVQAASTALLASLAGKKGADRIDTSADAAKLAQQSLEFMKIGDFEQGARLAEASLLLRPEQIDLRYSLSSIYIKLARLQYDDPRMDKPRFDRQFRRALTYAERGLLHLQIYYSTSKVDPEKRNVWGANLTSFKIHRHADESIRTAILKHTRDIREVFIEALLVKARRGEMDWYTVSRMLSPALGYYHDDEGRLKQFLEDRVRLLRIVDEAPELRRHVYGSILQHGIPITHPDALAFYKSLLDASDQELAAAAKSALAEANTRMTRQRALSKRANISSRKRQRPGEKQTDDSGIHIRFKPTVFDYEEGKRRTAIRLRGILSDEHDNEIVWGFHGPRVVLQRNGDGPFRKIFEADRRHVFGWGCFDGRHVWLPVSGTGSRLLRIDPTNCAVVSVGAEHGLPKIESMYAVTAALEPGRIVLVAGFGQAHARRAFVADVSWQQGGAPRVRILHEAREASIEVDRQAAIANLKENTNIAYLPKFVLVLRDKLTSIPTHVLIGRSLPGTIGRHNSLVVDLRSGQAAVSPVQLHSHITPDNVVMFQDAAYWLANKKVWRVAAESPEVRQAIADIQEHAGTLYMTEDGILIVGYQCWFSESWSKPFRRVPSDPEKFYKSSTHSRKYSQTLGPLLTTSQNGWQTYRVEIVREGHPAN